jgi:SOS-response transcriptional repressor LexA/DNA-binding XRE family transcriptional regulator
MQWLDHIRQRKKEFGYTNETLSEKSGISVGTLNKLLSGATTDPKLSTLLALADTFHCSIDELLGLKKEERSCVPKAFADKYAELDEDGIDAVSYIINKEYTRVLKERASMPYSLDVPATRKIRLYDTPASAGTGSYLFGDQFSEITIYTNNKTESADFAVRVYGDSMMPRFENGDILLVEGADEILKGELGIFSINGESYFKKYEGDSLISLNPMYGDIHLGDNDRIICFGRVIGKLKK